MKKYLLWWILLSITINSLNVSSNNIKTNIDDDEIDQKTEKTDGKNDCNEGNYFIEEKGLCVNCTKGYTKKETNRNECFCPDGKFIYHENFCIVCEKGTYSTNNNTNKCLSCPTFKTTKSFNSNSKQKCTEINIYHLIYAFIALSSIILAMICCLILVITTKINHLKNKKNQTENCKPKILHQNQIIQVKPSVSDEHRNKLTQNRGYENRPEKINKNKNNKKQSNFRNQEEYYVYETCCLIKE